MGRDGGVKSVYHLSSALVEVTNGMRDAISNLCHRDWVARTCDPLQRARVRAAEEETSSRQIRWAAAVLPFRQIREEAKSNPVFSSTAAMCVNMPAASWHIGRSGAVDEVGTSVNKAPVLFGDLIVHSEETRVSLILSVLLEAVLADLIQAPVLMTTARSMAVIVLFTIAVYGVDVSRPIRASAKGLVAVGACVSSPMPTTGGSRAFSGVETREKPLRCRRSGLFDRTRRSSSDVHQRRG